MFELLPENSASIEETLSTLGWIGPGQRIETLTPAGEGNMNRTLRANLSPGAKHYADSDTQTSLNSLILKQSVPFVAKYPDIPAPVNRCASEADFYRAASESSNVRALMPRLMGYDADRHLLSFEDLGEAADFLSRYQGIPFKQDQQRQLLHWLAELHSLLLAPGDWPSLENLAMRQLNHEHIFDLPLRRSNGLDLDAITTGLDELAEEMIQDEKLISSCQLLGQLYLGATNDNSVLLHGDFYPGSWLEVDTGDGASGVRIIDPEFGFFGPREFDLGVYIAHCCFIGLNSDAIDRALDWYSERASSQPGRNANSLDLALTYAFAGVEIIRRLLGVAQLPLNADLNTKSNWLNRAREWVTGYEWRIP